jgi:putative SOS response-associated peptidase YedK
MCGRYTLTTSGPRVAKLFRLDATPSLPFRYNVAPSQPVPAVRADAAGRSLALLRWGLIPSWAADPSIGNRLLNARSETVAQKAAFRAAFRQRRCLLPADGFFEWRKEGRLKQPYLFRLQGGGPFAFAGLWEQWKGPDGVTVESATVLTTGANELVRPLHERMPVILRPEDHDRWLAPGPRRPARLAGAADPLPRRRDDGLTGEPVGQRRPPRGPRVCRAGGAAVRAGRRGA